MSGHARNSAGVRRVRKALEQLGHSDLDVWWEPKGAATEMCGEGGGFMFKSAQSGGTWPLGFSVKDALAEATKRHSLDGSPRPRA